jgi:hypothetical protein
MVLASMRPPAIYPLDHAQITRDVEVLYNAGQERIGTDEARRPGLDSLLKFTHIFSICGSPFAIYSLIAVSRTFQRCELSSSGFHHPTLHRVFKCDAGVDAERIRGSIRVSQK